MDQNGEEGEELVALLSFVIMHEIVVAEGEEDEIDSILALGWVIAEGFGKLSEAIGQAGPDLLYVTEEAIHHHLVSLV